MLHHELTQMNGRTLWASQAARWPMTRAATSPKRTPTTTSAARVPRGGLPAPPMDRCSMTNRGIVSMEGATPNSAGSAVIAAHVSFFVVDACSSADTNLFSSLDMLCRDACDHKHGDLQARI